MIPVRQSTAFETAIGPVLDADGVAVTDCVVGDFKLKKTTGNFAALNGSATLTHVSAGFYDLVLTTSDTDTVGTCCIAIDDTTNACAPLYLQVVEEAVYDALFAASAAGYQVPIWAAANSTVNLSGTTVNLVNTATTLTNAPSDSSGVTTLLSRIGGSITISGGAVNANVTHFGGSAGTFSSGRPEVNTTHWGGTAVASANVRANLVQVGGNTNPITSIVTVFDTDFADNYDDTNNMWRANVRFLKGEDFTYSGSFDFDQLKTAYEAVNTNLDATISSRMATYTQPTGFLAATFPTTVASTTNITAGTITTVTNLTNAPTSGDLTATMKASVNAEVDTALADIRLDELLSADSDIDGAAPPTVGSVFHELMTKTAGSFTYDQTTDSLEALRDRGDAAWITATGFSTHSASDVWAVGTRVLTAATNISGPIADQVWLETLADHSGSAGSTAEALNAAGSAGDPWTTTLPGSYTGSQAGKILADILVDTGTTLDGLIQTVDTVVDAIKVKTDYLPSATAGAAGGVFIAGSNAATTVNITGNITGNLSGSVGSISGITFPTNFGSTVISAGGVVSADTVAVSGDTTAANNLESYLDGTDFMPVDAHKPLFSISGATLTVKKPDGTTTAYTRTLTTDATADPVTGSS